MPPVLLGIAGLGVSLWHDPMRMKRIFSWLHLEEHKSGTGYQAYQAMLALGTGGWTGLGLGNGRQKLGFVPEHHTDFIFSIIGEELGLIATLLVIVAFMAMMICGIYIARRARDTFGLLLGSGITLLIGLQAFINIGVVTSALPNKGLPLPFISYGGSNLLVMLTCVGLAPQHRPPGPHAGDHARGILRGGRCSNRMMAQLVTLDCHRLRRHRRPSLSRPGRRRATRSTAAAPSPCSSPPRKWTSRRCRRFPAWTSSRCRRSA